MILIIGYGNPLRSDDGIGQRIALMMEQRLNEIDVQVSTAFQLTPELVEPIHHARRVVFVDARVGETPGMLFQEIVEPAADPAAFTHHTSPASLLDAAFALYNVKSAGILISIIGATFDFGSELSPQLQYMLPGLADQVEQIIRSFVGGKAG